MLTAEHVSDKDPQWAATIAYHSMLRAGRALLFANGVLPADGRQPAAENLSLL